MEQKPALTLLQRAVRYFDRRMGVNLGPVIRPVTMIVTSNGIASILRIIVLLVLANLILPDAYGTYKYAVVVLELFGIATLTGTKVSSMRALGEGKLGVFPTIVGLKLASGYAVSPFVAAFGIWLAYTGKPTEAIVFWLIALIGPLYHATQTFLAYEIGLGRHKRLSQITIAYEVIKSIVLIGTALVDQAGLALFFATLALTLVHILFLIPALRESWKGEKDPGILTSTLFQSAIDAVGILAQRLDYLLIYAMLGPAELAIYALALQPVEHLKGLLNSTFTPLWKRAAHHPLDAIRSGLKNKIIVSVITGSAMSIGYIVTVPILFRIAFPAYVAAVPYTQLLSLTFPTFLVITLILTYVMIKNLRRMQTVITITNQGLQLVLLALLTPIFGIGGAIVSRMLTDALASAVSWYLMARAKPINSHSNHE